MYQFDRPFDPSTVEPTSFAPVPPMGDYHVRIVDSEVQPTADKQSGFLRFDLEILDPGPFQGAKVPYRLNLFNTKSQTTVEMAYRQLSALCWCTVNGRAIQNAAELHGIAFMAKIGPQTDNPQYSNVFAVMDINGNLPKGMKGQQQPAAPVPFGAPAAPPAAAPAAAPTAWGPPAPAPAPPQPAPTAWGPPQPTAPPAQAWGPPAPAPTAWQPGPAAAAPAAAAPSAKAPWER